jgi:protein SCO1/2
MSLRLIRIVAWTAVVVVALILAGVYALGRHPGGTPAAANFGQGDYRLETAAGQPFTEASLAGAPSLLFFGYTHCPDVCPTTMADMALWFHELGPEGKALRAFFVSVDPSRDTPAVLGDYVKAVSDRITGVTGSQAETDKIEQAWGIYAAKVPAADGGADYTMNHTATVYLVDSKGRFQGTIAYQEDDATALKKLRNLIAKG